MTASPSDNHGPVNRKKAAAAAGYLWRRVAISRPGRPTGCASDRPRDQLPRPGPTSPSRTGAPAADRRAAAARMRQVSSTPSWRVKRLLSPHRGVQQHLVRGRALAALGGELHVEVDRGRPVASARWASSTHPHAGVGIDPDHDLVGLGRRCPPGRKPKARRVAEDQAQLGLASTAALAGPDEERHARPAPVVDLQAQGRVGLGRRVGRDAVDLRGSRRTGRARSAAGSASGIDREHVALGVLERSGSPPAGGSIAAAASTCIRWLTTTSRSAPTGS